MFLYIKKYIFRLTAFRWRWENPRKELHKGPYIPRCESDGDFIPKQVNISNKKVFFIIFDYPNFKKS